MDDRFSIPLKLYPASIELMPKITEDLLLAGRATAGGWKKAQLALIGVAWPPPKGWKATVIGTDISDEDAARFLALRDGAVS